MSETISVPLVEDSRQRSGSRASRTSVASKPVEHHLSGRDDNISKITESVMGDEEMMQICGCGWSKNARVYIVSLVLFTTITAAQSAGALIAHSMALLADCASMALDALTYSGNLWAECRPEPDLRKRQRNQLIASGLSFAALVGISAYFVHDAAVAIRDKDWADDDVNEYIVFGFATAGIVFDLLSLAPYCMYGMPCLKKKDDVDAGAEQMNLCSALMHVSADLMRSTTTLVESILIWGWGVNGSKADAYATVIVSSTIILGAAKPMYDWCIDLRTYLNESGDDEAKYNESAKDVEAIQ